MGGQRLQLTGAAPYWFTMRRCLKLEGAGKSG
jgi:hypothetical protein